jgi:hypothetical protein
MPKLSVSLMNKFENPNLVELKTLETTMRLHRLFSLKM